MINVTCALIRNDDDNILVVQRGEKTDHPFKWEFPGGKLKEGESEEDCIIREVGEELSLDIVICDRLQEVRYDYGYKKVRLIPFICDTLIDLPLLSEHVDFRWVHPDELKKIDLSEADVPVAQNYLRKFSANRTGISKNDDLSNVDAEKIREILTGHISSDACEMVAESALENRAVMNLIIEFSLGEDNTLAFRSSWSLTKAAEKEPESILPWNGRLIEALPDLENESVIRSFLKVINQANFDDLSEKEHGIIAECSFSWLNKPGSAIAVKAYAMEALYKLTLIYSELRDELRLSASRLEEHGSAGLKVRGRYIIERMAKDRSGIK
ncbi:MAG TPA: (deoxy)nucleoside triphosphate pyrophosphohydrolase [Bacteroidales bacterium]|nr:(deoxy)nucleoside triphosphate pyrophosphohydrolase [Bacteroidales bacterium]